MNSQDILTALAAHADITAEDSSPATGGELLPGFGRQRAQFRWLVGNVIMNFAAIAIDRIAIGDMFETVLAIRLFVLMPLLLACLALHMWSTNLRLRSAATAAATIAFIVAVAAFGQFAGDTFANRYMMIAIFMLFAAILFAGVPLRATKTMMWVSVVLYAVVVISALKWTVDTSNIDLAVMALWISTLALRIRKRQDKQMSEIQMMRRIDAERAEELREANRRLSLLSNTDALTGVYNRRYLDEVMNGFSTSLAPFARYGVLMIDVDHFKRLNDHGGHQEGDRCLRLVATAIRNSLDADNGTVVRFGGEEFAVILRDADLSASIATAERIRLAVADLRIPHPALGDQSRLTISIGVFGATIADDLSDALSGADTALYAAKKAGRDQVVAFRPACIKAGV